MTLWREVDGVELTEGLAIRAGELAEVYALRGYDACTSRPPKPSPIRMRRSSQLIASLPRPPLRSA